MAGDIVKQLRDTRYPGQLEMRLAAADRIDELEGVIDRADQHTAMLMKSIASLETRLKAAEYAARVNYDGWQQEMARSDSSGVREGKS